MEKRLPNCTARQPRRGVRCQFLGLLACLLVGNAFTANAGEPPKAAEADAQWKSQLNGLLNDLDHPSYEVRTKAERTLSGWVARAQYAPLLAAEFQRRLLQPDLPFEVRAHLRRWQKQLPEASIAAPARVNQAELDRLVTMLDDDQYGRRVGAVERLKWLIDNGVSLGDVMSRLRERLRQPGLSPELRLQLEQLWNQARGAWLASNDQTQLPPVGNDQIRRWIDDLVSPVPEKHHGVWPTHQTAERELLDLLVRDDCVAQVAKALEARLNDVQETSARTRLRELLDWTRPAMVAEYWQEHKHRGEQHLLVNVPSQAENAPRPSHFNRIDDRTAHCVSGATLTPGDYPVGVAFPHPYTENAFFHLVNLPTPRRRLAYQYLVKRDPARRLADITRRTCQRWLDDKHPLDERELMLLRQLDATEVSRFAGKYFNLLADEPILVEVDPQLEGDRPSRHNMICALLVASGTKEAMPGLLEALEQKRFLEPAGPAPWQIAWCAALAITQRERWPDSDKWLARAIERNEPLVVRRPSGPEIGATAAAILLRRHGQLPDRFGLESAGELLDKPTGLSGFRFSSSDARREVLDWWKGQGQP